MKLLLGSERGNFRRLSCGLPVSWCPRLGRAFFSVFLPSIFFELSDNFCQEGVWRSGQHAPVWCCAIAQRWGPLLPALPSFESFRSRFCPRILLPGWLMKLLLGSERGNFRRLSCGLPVSWCPRLGRASESVPNCSRVTLK